MSTTAFTNEAAKQEGVKPRWLLQIDLPVSGTIYLSDQDIPMVGPAYRGLVKEWGSILTEEETIGNFDIVILNHNDTTYGRFSDYEKTNIFTNATIRLYKWFVSLPDADKSPDFKGVIDDWSYNANELTLNILDGTLKEHKDIPDTTLDYLSYVGANQNDIGKYFPIVFGEPGEELNSQKINKGYNSAPTLLIDKANRKYLVAGHVSYSAPTIVWCALSGISDGYAYMEGCTVNTNDGGYTTIFLPATMMCGYFLTGLAQGNYFTYTAQNIANVCDRNTATNATLNATYPLLGVAVGAIDTVGTISKVKIATSVAHSGCRARWAGPRAYLYAGCSAGATSITIDSGAGMDTAGFMEINGDRFSHTTLTEDSTGAFWTVGGIPSSGADAIDSSHSANDPCVMVGDWVTLTSAEMEITSQRDWSNFDFYKFEVVVQWQSGANYTPSYIGFRVEFEISDYPKVYAPIKGWSLTNRRNAIEQIKKIYTEYLGRASGDIGDSFATYITELENLAWKMDISIAGQINTKGQIAEMLKECKTRLWLDGDGKPQVKVFKFGERSGRTIHYDTDIVDSDGTGFSVENTSMDEIYNEVYLNFCLNYDSGNYTKQYYITATDSYPTDSTRQTRASQSRSDYGTTNRHTLDAQYIQDETTALALLQYLFDYYHRRRKIVKFTVALQHHDIHLGDIVLPIHFLNPYTKSFEVVNITATGNLIQVKAREYGIETLLSDTVNFSDAVTKKLGQGYGKDGYGVKYGGNFAAV